MMSLVVIERFDDMIAECDLLYETFHLIASHGFAFDAIQAMIHSGSWKHV
jgi:hypothetical protein